MSLPSGYKRLEYIRFSGTQYLPSITIPQDFKIEVTLKAGNTGSYMNIYDHNFAKPMLWIDGNKVLEMDTVKSGYTLGTEKVTIVSDSTGDSSVLSVNGTVVQTVTKVTGTSFTVTLFNRAGSQCFVGDLFTLKVSSKTETIVDYVPCIDASGNVGVYDLVGKQFYVSAGAGTFTAGTVLAISADESEITELEYIQSSGNEYINTGVFPNQNTRIDFNPSTSQTGSHTMTGADISWTGNGFAIGVGFAHYGTETANISGMNDGNAHDISLNKNVLSVDGEVKHTFSSQTFSIGYSLALFANNRAESIQEITEMNLHTCQIYDDGTLIRDYISAKLSDGTVGLYDKLHGLLYINMGTGTFTAGPVVASPSIFVNIDGIWKPINHIYVNINNIWQKST